MSDQAAKLPKCEHCDAPSVESVHDWQETPTGWVKGAEHHYCTAHRKLGKHVFINGTVMGG